MAKSTDQGRADALNVYFKAASRSGSGNLYLGLYTNTSEPAAGATLASGLTELPVTNGYARIALADADWTISGDLATNLQKTFTASGGDWGDVYGYFICDVASGTSGNLLYVEQFGDGPYNVLDTQTVKVTPAVLAS